jgi:hypothetical protein
VKKLNAVGYELRVLSPAESVVEFARERADYGKLAAGGRLDRAN